MAKLDKTKVSYSEQDTADKLILPYLTEAFGFPAPGSLDYQAQHTVNTEADKFGKYDGLYLSGGYPYALLEAKRYAHELDEKDEHQARAYATGGFFHKPVPFVVISNGREHRFLKKTDTIDPKDGKLVYSPIPATSWANIISTPPGEVLKLLSASELLDILLEIKRDTFKDISAIFTNEKTGKFSLDETHPLSAALSSIIEERKKYISVTASTEQKRIQFSIEAISLHFTIKILFIKLIEDLSSGPGTPRVIHTLFPRKEYDLMGGLFGFKVLNALSNKDSIKALRLYVKSSRFYKRLSRDLAQVSWQDIFRYSFNVHTHQYGKIFKAQNYDRFLPSEHTLAYIRDKLITIDTRFAVIYRSPEEEEPENVVGHIYERLIDDELRNSIGAVYTPDATVTFMSDLSLAFLGQFRGNKIVEPSCGSGHFYRKIYRHYVDEVLAAQEQYGHPRDALTAHLEALSHIYGRDIDPFAVQLTLLGTFLEQLRDNVQPTDEDAKRTWSADHAIDTQNSLDPITISPDLYFDIEKTSDLHRAISRQRSSKRAENPRLVIGNPPYGVKVSPGAHYSDIYDLQSNDSYAYFIVNAVKRLAEGGRVIFIVSSSFLTISSHLKLRQFLLSTVKIVRLIKLHRATFPGIDIFPVIIELEKCSSSKERDNNVYQFYDAWQLHPIRDEPLLKAVYVQILGDLGAKKPWPFNRDKIARFTVRQGLLKRFTRVPIFDALPKLFEFMQDVFSAPPPELPIISLDAERTKMVRSLKIRGRDVVQLRHIAEVKIGLQSGNNSKFYRVREGVSGGAVKGGYKQITLDMIVSDESLEALSPQEKSNGIQVDDPSNDRYFVPLDKTAEADIEAGLLSMFYQPVDFYVDWSKSAVDEMKSLIGARFQNHEYYFRRGISFSNTGLYSPTFRLSHGGVFDQKGSCIFSDFFEPEFLLGVLASTLIKYFVKSFINHGVDAQLDDLPIVLPSAEQRTEIISFVQKIVAVQKANPTHDYRSIATELDQKVFELYGLDVSEMEEVRDWHKRRYPALLKGAVLDAVGPH
jgi:type I restriction-modification system DNA methylase subunit